MLWEEKWWLKKKSDSWIGEKEEETERKTNEWMNDNKKKTVVNGMNGMNWE